MAQTTTSTGTVAGYFHDNGQAVQAVEALKSAGFGSAHLGVAHQGGSSTDSGTSHESGGPGVWDKIRNFFDGNTSEAYADENSQGDLANREVTPNPDDAGYNAYGADLHGNLSGLNVAQDRSRYFAHKLGSSGSGTVVTVNAGDRVSEAETILTRYGADLGEQAESFAYPETGSSATEVEEPARIQLLGEVLRVHKDRVSRGEVRMRKEVITEMQTVQVPVTREELVIERHAATGTEAVEGTVGSGEEIRIPLTEERASLDKSTVVREEVNVGKKKVEEVRDLTGDVRREDLVVEDSTTLAGRR